MGKRGSGCFFLRESLKKVVVVWTVCVVVVVLPYTRSPELASDLEDSESLVTGRARLDVWSSPYAGGALDELGRFNGSSGMLWLLPAAASGSMVLLLSFLPSSGMGSWPSWGIGSCSSGRPNRESLNREGRLRGALSNSAVGAVLMMLGTGGASGWAAAWALALAASCESEAFRNLNMLGLSSPLGGGSASTVGGWRTTLEKEKGWMVRGILSRSASGLCFDVRGRWMGFAGCRRQSEGLRKMNIRGDAGSGALTLESWGAEHFGWWEGGVSEFSNDRC